MLLSIVIVNWNGKKLLNACLESVCRQAFKKPMEVIVVDNGSTDGSVDFVKENFPEAVIVRNEENLGFAKANNQGISLAKGKYIATINNDTELTESFLEELIDAAEASGERVGMWAPKILSFDGQGMIDSVGGLLIYRDGLAKGRGRLEKDNGQYDSPEEVFIPSACAALYRKSMLDSIGGFDEEFFAYCEDTDLGLRARIAGWKARNVPKAVIRHHYSATGGKYTPFKALLVERNHLWVAVKNFPTSMLLACPFYIIWRYMVQGYGIITNKGAGGRFVDDFSSLKLLSVLIKSYIEAVSGLPSMLRKRGSVRRLRTVRPKEIKSWFKRYGLSATEIVLND